MLPGFCVGEPDNRSEAPKASKEKGTGKPSKGLEEVRGRALAENEL